MKRCPAASQGALTARIKRSRRKVWSQEKARIRRGGYPRPESLRLGKTFIIKIAAPATLGVATDPIRGPSVEFLSQIREQSQRSGVSLHINFSMLSKIHPSGAVLLLAEIDKALTNTKLRLQVTRPRNSIADQVLQQIGVYERCSVPCEAKPSHESVIHWRMATGVLSDGQSGGSILLDYQGRLAEGITKGLYDGIIEAMTNTVHHAYDGPEGEKLKSGIGKRWWMLSQEKDGKFTVAICDLGIGIPKSLPQSRSFRWEDVLALWQNLGLDKRDSNAIKVALRIGETRTGEKGRGKGLADIVKAVNHASNGNVRIFSNKGSFASDKGKEYARDHARPIRGTLINWQVPIAE